MRRRLGTSLVAVVVAVLGLLVGGPSASYASGPSVHAIQLVEQGPQSQWYPWGYYASQSSCLSAGAAYQADPNIISYKCLKLTSGANAGKWQLWLLEKG